MLKLIDFHAQWCGPCKMINPILDELKKEYEGVLEIEKLDVDIEKDKVSEFKVRNVPTLIFIKDGIEVDRSIGAVTKKVLVDKIEKFK